MNLPVAVAHAARLARARTAGPAPVDAPWERCNRDLDRHAELTIFCLVICVAWANGVYLDRFLGAWVAEPV